MLKHQNKSVILNIIALIIFQILLYFFAKITPFDYHIVNIDFDSYIPFISLFVYPYVIWYITLFLFPYLFSKYDIKFYKIYIRTIVIALSMAFIIYVFFPTTIIRDQIISKDIATFIINLIYKIDTPAINCLPSAHCIISFTHIYIALFIKNMPKKIKIIIIIQSILVIFSTLFIKQHVILDVISAFILSLIIYLINFFMLKRI